MKTVLRPDPETKCTCIDSLTGQSRGFAFVEFETIPEAIRWMEMEQVMLLAFLVLNFDLAAG